MQEVVRKLAAEAEGGGSSSGFGGGSWRSSELPRGYSDVTDSIDVKGLELLNSDDEFGSVRTLFDDSKPSALDSKGKAGEKKDWVESDTDEQLMLYIPFQNTLKVHTLQVGILSLPTYVHSHADGSPYRSPPSLQPTPTTKPQCAPRPSRSTRTAHTT